MQLGGAFATYAVGRMTNSPRAAIAGADLVRAQLLSQAVTHAIKRSVRRVRPDGDNFSFPSGHTSTTFASATILQRLFGWKVGVLLASGLAGHPPVRVLQALAPGSAPARVMAQVADAARGRRVALVGHEPALGELAAFLIGARHAIPFKKGGVCRIDVETMASRAPGTLVWLATPRILRRLAT